MPRPSSRPIAWRLLDGAEAVARRLWPRPLRGQTGYLLLTPAVLLVGLLAIGLGYMADYSLRELDLSTYRLVDEYSLTNYQILWDRPVFTRVFLRTLLAAVLVTVFSLLLAFPYAYVMVRTIALEHRRLAIVHIDGDGDRDGALWIEQAVAPPFRNLEKVCDAVKLAPGHFEDRTGIDAAHVCLPGRGR